MGRFIQDESCVSRAVSEALRASTTHLITQATAPSSTLIAVILRALTRPYTISYHRRRGGYHSCFYMCCRARSAPLTPLITYRISPLRGLILYLNSDVIGPLRGPTTRPLIKVQPLLLVLITRLIALPSSLIASHYKGPTGPNSTFLSNNSKHY